jgi:hypothetical protein
VCLLLFPEDTPDKLDYDHMAHVVDGVQSAVGEVVSGEWGEWWIGWIAKKSIIRVFKSQI